MFSNGNRRTTILDSQELEGVKFGSGVIIEPYAVIYEGCEIGDQSVISSHAVLRPRTIIGKNTIFGTHSVSEGDNQIGNCSTLHAQCHLTKGMSIGDDVFIAPFFIASNTPNITAGHHGTYPGQEQYKWLKGTIQDRVRIGINVSVIPGIRIGHDSVIYQNCLITKDIPPFSIVRGGKDQIGRVIGEVEP
jgi:acetyltransferase-like isoleucine patch superfamily enzyme